MNGLIVEISDIQTFWRVTCWSNFNKEKGFLFSDLMFLYQVSRRRFDATGHYSRPDIFSKIDKRKKK